MGGVELLGIAGKSIRRRIRRCIRRFVFLCIDQTVEIYMSLTKRVNVSRGQRWSGWRKGRRVDCLRCIVLMIKEQFDTYLFWLYYQI